MPEICCSHESICGLYGQLCEGALLCESLFQPMMGVPFVQERISKENKPLLMNAPSVLYVKRHEVNKPLIMLYP